MRIDNSKLKLFHAPQSHSRVSKVFRSHPEGCSARLVRHCCCLQVFDLFHALLGKSEAQERCFLIPHRNSAREYHTHDRKTDRRKIMTISSILIEINDCITNHKAHAHDEAIIHTLGTILCVYIHSWVGYTIFSSKWSIVG